MTLQCFDLNTTLPGSIIKSFANAVWQASSEANFSVAPSPLATVSMPSPAAKLFGRRTVHSYPGLAELGPNSFHVFWSVRPRYNLSPYFLGRVLL